MAKQKQFKDLKQLDRIEYFLLNKERQNYSLLSISMVYIMVQVIILIMLFGILFVGFFHSTYFFERTLVIFPVLRYAIIFSIGFDICQIILSMVNKNKLDKRFGLR